MSEEIKEYTLKFHNTYEKLATNYGYETRKDTKEFDFNSNNGKLMYATVSEIISPLLQKVEQKDKEIDRLNKEYERIYNENCKLRENHNINDITLLDENERLNRIIDNIFKFMQNKYDNSDLTGFTISFMELQDLKALKEE